jgi:hypothetical protein
MNPYLENPELWPEVHNRLIVALADDLNPQLLPKYRAAIDRRVYHLDNDDAVLVGIPDVTVEQRSTSSPENNVAVMAPPASPVKVRVPMPIEIRESFLKIKDLVTGEVVTVIEILSPTNKRPGRGRQTYEEKRREILSSQTHLIEIDLLRSGEPMALMSSNIKSDYRILVSRSDQRPQADLYAFNLPDEIPCFQLPLKPDDQQPVVDLKNLLDQVYERAGYDMVIDYKREAIPPIETKYNYLLESSQ